MTRKLKLQGLLAIAASLLASQVSADTIVGYVSPIGSQPSQQYLVKGLEMASLGLGWSVRVLDANLSVDRQVSHLDTLVTMGAKAIATWSLDANAVAGVFARTEQQGIPVIGVNSTGEGVTATVFWEVNLCRDGGPFARQAAFIASRKPGAKVIIMGGPPVESIIKNMNCAAKAAEAAGLTIIDRLDNPKDTASAAATLASSELVRFPEVDAFIAYNDITALGIASSAIAAGQSIYGASGTKGLMIFGLNGDLDALQAVRDGRMTATWDPDPYSTGLAVIMAMDAAIKAPQAPQKDLIVSSLFVSYETVGNWKDWLERGTTYATIPLTE
jgi:ribose transport system substrate-binding protein